MENCLKLLNNPAILIDEAQELMRIAKKRVVPYSFNSYENFDPESMELRESRSAYAIPMQVLRNRNVWPFFAGTSLSLKDAEIEDSSQGKSKCYVFNNIKYWTQEAIKQFMYQHFNIQNEAKEYFEKEIVWKLVGRARFTASYATNLFGLLKKNPTSKSDPDSVLIKYLEM